jgi:hypothetical protein
MDLHDEDTPSASGAPESGSATGPTDVSAAEARLEALADEIGIVLASSPASEREALHDYAVSLVRERLPAVDGGYTGKAESDDDAGTVETPQRESSAAVTSVGYGALLFLPGLLLLLVFPPVGMMLVIVGAGLVAWGVLAAVFVRLTPKRLRPS